MFTYPSLFVHQLIFDGMLTGGVDFLKLRSEGPSQSISSETETHSSDKVRVFHDALRLIRMLLTPP